MRYYLALAGSVLAMGLLGLLIFMVYFVVLGWKNVNEKKNGKMRYLLALAGSVVATGLLGWLVFVVISLLLGWVL